jgi:hypothetical protein
VRTRRVAAAAAPSLGPLFPSAEEIEAADLSPDTLLAEAEKAPIVGQIRRWAQEDMAKRESTPAPRAALDWLGAGATCAECGELLGACRC